MVHANPKLGPSVLRLLQQHLASFVDTTQDALCPLLLQKAVKGQGEAAQLVEPLGDLISCLVRCKIRFQKFQDTSTDDDHDEEGTATLGEVQALLDALTEGLAYVDIDDLELGGGGAGPTEHLRHQLAVGVLDALIEENFCNGALRSESHMKKVLALFKTQQTIVRLVRDRGKDAKKDRGESKGKGRPPPTGSGKRGLGQAVSFRSVLSLGAAASMLRVTLLGEEAAEPSAVALLENNADLDMYLVSVFVQAASELKDMTASQRDRILPDLKAASGLILKECGNCLVAEFDEEDERQINRTRCFVSGLQALVAALVIHYKDKLPQVFREMTGKSPTTVDDDLFYAIAKACLKMTLRILHNDDRQRALAKEATALTQLVGQVAEQMSPGCTQLTSLMEAVDQVCKDQAVENAALAEALVELLLKLTDRVRLSSSVVRSLARALHHCLSDIHQDVTVEAVSDYNLLTQASSTGVLTAVCSYCEQTFSVLEVALSKQRECLTEGNPVQVQELDRRMSLKLAVIVHTLHEIFQSAVPEGGVQHHVLRTAAKFYSCMTNYVKYQLFLFRLKPSMQMSEKFEKLIHACTSLLKNNAFYMISYTQDIQGRTSKKSQPSRALKETRLIPELIYAMEQYENHLVQLAAKSKVDLMAGNRTTTARDFRINAEAIKPTEDEEEEEEEEKERSSENEDEEKENPSPRPKKRRKN